MSTRHQRPDRVQLGAGRAGERISRSACPPTLRPEHAVALVIDAMSRPRENEAHHVVPCHRPVGSSLRNLADRTLIVVPVPCRLSRHEAGESQCTAAIIIAASMASARSYHCTASAFAHLSSAWRPAVVKAADRVVHRCCPILRPRSGRRWPSHGSSHVERLECVGSAQVEFLPSDDAGQLGDRSSDRDGRNRNPN